MFEQCSTSPGSNIFSAGRMESGHLDFTLEDIRVEQESIDKLIDSLLSFNPASSSTSSRQSSGNDNIASPAPIRGRGPGRPKVQKTSATRPPLSPSPLPSEGTSLSTIIQCLNKLNVQNKRLLEFVENVSENVKKCTRTVNSESNGGDDVVNQQQQSIDDVNSRLEKIEQNINANNLVCRGGAVDDLIRASSLSGEPPNFERLKGDICKIACGEDITGVDIVNTRVSIIGKAKRCIKISCANSQSKLHILKKTRARKPEGFYISEFLTPTKLKVFHNLRNLKKQHPNKIKSVFTRGGNVSYTLHNSDRVFQVSHLSELNNIVRPETPQGSSGLV